jgi:DNA polymerase III alpha subunit
MNKQHLKFANWFFETELLGYSYSYNIRQIFKDQDGSGLMSSQELKQAEPRGQIKFVGTISDITKRTSANGNKYARLDLQDELGTVSGLFMDSANKERLTEYVNSGKKLPVKGDMVIIYGTKGDDIIFIEKINILKEKIYMKLSQLK